MCIYLFVIFCYLLHSFISHYFVSCFCMFFSSYIESHPNMVGYTIASTNIFRKYLGVIDLFCTLRRHSANQTYSTLSAMKSSKKHNVKYDTTTAPSSLCYVLLQPWRNIAAMKAHYSQFVWFRWLFVVFSRYTFINTLHRITVQHQTS